MFLGHFAAGMAAKAAAPRVSLGTLFLSAQFVDLIWPTLLLAGVERVEIEPGITAFNPLNFVHYPISHSLLMTVVWGIVIGGLYWITRKNARSAFIVGALVVSHWVLDLIVHRPDLPIGLGESTHVGLGLWHSVAATVAIEAILFLIGVVIYARVTTARDFVGRFAFWGLIGFLVLIFVVNSFGPPPPDVSTIAWVGQAQWLLVAWAYWVDHHRIAGTNRSSFPR